MGGKIPGEERIALLEQRVEELALEYVKLRELTKGKGVSVAEKEERKEEKGEPT